MARSSDFNFQIKGTARQAVTGHLGTTVGSILFYCITALLLSNITVSIFPGSDVGSTIGFEAVNFIIQLFLGLLAYGINYQHLLLVYGQNTTFGDLFAGFRRGVNDRVIKVTAVLALISFCCTLPATLVMSTCADAAEMIEKIREKGYYPMIYASENWFRRYLKVDALKQYDFWAPQYLEENDFLYDFTIWQYTDKGSIPGVKGEVDLDISMVDYASFVPGLREAYLTGGEVTEAGDEELTITAQ